MFISGYGDRFPYDLILFVIIVLNTFISGVNENMGCFMSKSCYLKN